MSGQKNRTHPLCKVRLTCTDKFGKEGENPAARYSANNKNPGRPERTKTRFMKNGNTLRTKPLCPEQGEGKEKTPAASKNRLDACPKPAGARITGSHQVWLQIASGKAGNRSPARQPCLSGISFFIHNALSFLHRRIPVPGRNGRKSDQ